MMGYHIALEVSGFRFNENQTAEFDLRCANPNIIGACAEHIFKVGIYYMEEGIYEEALEIL